MKLPGACSQCGSAEINPPDEGRFAECADCGEVFYDEYTLSLIAEVKREQAAAKQVMGYVPSFAEAVEKGLTR